MSSEYDVIVIGAGPGGYVAAIRAAQLGKKAAVVEKDEVGGVCLNRGCIPSKSLISASHRYQEALQGAEMGIETAETRVNFAKVQSWKQGIVKKLTGGVQSLFKGYGVDLIRGTAQFAGPHEIRVVEGGQSAVYRFKHCILASGSRPIELKPFPYQGRILSSTEALELAEIPQSIAVIGGGYIGIELGQTFAKFGAKVTVIEGTEQILPQFEAEVVRWVQRRLKKDGVDLITKAKAISAVQTDKDVTLTYEADGREQSITADYLLVTVGRAPNTNDLGLETIGIKTNERGLVQVDAQGRTTVPHIFAIGDIVAGPALAHKASYEGKVAAEAIAGLNSSVHYKAMPAIVFCDPEIASVGLNESEAKQKGLEVISGKFNYAANGRALSLNAYEGFVKIIAEKDSQVIVGAQIVGPNASDLIAEMGAAVENELTLKDIAHTIHAHPTLGEIVAEAAENALGQGVHTVIK